MSAVLVRRARKGDAIERLPVASLLVIVGVEPKRVYRSHNEIPRGPSKGRHVLGRLNEFDLVDLLKDTKRIYRQTMKRVHPDAGGSLEEASRVTRAWRRIVQLFALRGVTL